MDDDVGCWMLTFVFSLLSHSPDKWTHNPLFLGRKDIRDKVLGHISTREPREKPFNGYDALDLIKPNDL